MIRAARVMGTVASLHVDTPAGDAPAAPTPPADERIAAATDDVFAELERLEAMFSTFRPDSQISRVNRGELDLLDCDPEVHDVLDACTWLEHMSAGAFSPWRPDRPDLLDPAGFVKGWATERATRYLVAAGATDWYLSVGGDIVVGARRDGEPWRVAIADPHHPGGILGTIDMSAGAVATSGTTERGRHVWDGRTGAAATELVSVTVIGPSLAWADAFATAALALGTVGLPWVRGFDGYWASAVTADGELLTAA